jgi:hypothetical protein
MFVPVTEAQPVKSVDVASAANSFVLFCLMAFFPFAYSVVHQIILMPLHCADTIVNNIGIFQIYFLNLEWQLKNPAAFPQRGFCL